MVALHYVFLFTQKQIKAVSIFLSLGVAKWFFYLFKIIFAYMGTLFYICINKMIQQIISNK